MSEKAISYLIIGVSLTVLAVVTVLYTLVPPQENPGFDIHIFPLINAVLNSMTAICLVSALYFIKQKKIKIHKAFNLAAFVLSSLFLVSYVIYHSFGQETDYGGDGILKYIYFFILITHIILAAGILPFILFTFYRALTGNIQKHRKLAKWTFPLWLYVAVTGVLVYLMISPYYH